MLDEQKRIESLHQHQAGQPLTTRVLEDGAAGINLAAPLVVGHPFEFSSLLPAIVRSEERVGPKCLGAVLLQFVKRVELQQIVGIHNASILQGRRCRRFRRHLTPLRLP